MPNQVWSEALKSAGQVESASQVLETLLQSPVGKALRTASEETAFRLALLFGGSPAMSELLLAHQVVGVLVVRHVQGDQVRFLE